MIEEIVELGGFINDFFYLVGTYACFNLNNTNNSLGRYYNKVTLL